MTSRTRSSEQASCFHMDVLESVPKNNRESYLVGLDQWQGHNLINLRIGLTCRGGEKKLTRKGLSISAERLPAVLAALEKAKQEAIARGWLKAA